MKKLVNHTTYTKEFMLESYKELFRVKYLARNLVSLAFAAFLLLVCLSTLLKTMRGQGAFSLNHALFILIAVGLIWTVFGGYASAARRTYDGMLQTGMSMDINYTFGDDGFEVETEDETFNIVWKQCMFCLPTQNLCLFVVKNKFYSVDFNGFIEGSSEDFLKLIQGKLKIRKPFSFGKS